MVEDLLTGEPQSVGPYRLLGRLGAGGMGQVYLARSPGGRLVAVKVIRPELAADHGFRARFAREVAAARTVSGIFTAPVVDADSDGPQPWLATGYVPGPSLTDAVAAYGPMPPGVVLTLAAGLAEGLQAIHAAGLVHRDLKPSNVLLADDGPRVIDFGISRSADASMLTQDGTIMGSPGFLSPEQAQGTAVGRPSDVFSLGSVLTYAATGAGPFGAGTVASLVYRVVNAEPNVAGVPEQLRPLIQLCLAKDPGSRPTAGELLTALAAGQQAPQWISPAVMAAWPGPGAGAGAAAGPAGAARPAGAAGAAGAAAARYGGPGHPGTVLAGQSGPGQPYAPQPFPASPGGADGGRTQTHLAPSPATSPGSPGQGRGPGRRTRTALIAGGVVVLAAASAGIALAAGGGGGNAAAGSSPSPSPVVRAATQAAPAQAASTPASMTASAPPGTAASAVVSSSGPADAAVTGDWTGTYTCNQGLTGVRLAIADEGAGTVRATVSFYAVPGNPGVPDGSYVATGSYSTSAGLVLNPDYWINEPFGYVMVGLSAPPPRGTAMQGTIQGGENCTVFSVTR